MTRNNLDLHLRWLVSTKPSLPPDVFLPPASASFNSVATAPSHDIDDIPDGAFDGELSDATTEAPEELATQTGPGQEMARLRAAPSSSSKPRLVSIPTGSQIENDKAASQSATKLESVPQTPVKNAWSLPTSGNSVEIMDLTKSLHKLKSPSLDRVVKNGSGRKRKSEEYRADLNDCPQHGSPVSSKVQRTALRSVPHVKQIKPDPDTTMGYTTIDKIMDDAPSEPPPPYSTVVPQPVSRSATSASGSRNARRQRTVMPDSEEDDEDVHIMIPTSPGNRSSPKPKRSVRVATIKDSPLASRQASHPASPSKPFSSSDAAKPPASSSTQGEPKSALELEDRHRLDSFFDLSSDAIRRILEDLKAREDAISEEIVECVDNEDLIGEEEKQKQLVQIEKRMNALKRLQSLPQQREKLLVKKEEALVKVRVAVKTKSGLAEARVENSKCKKDLNDFEAECLRLLDVCEQDINKCLRRAGASNKKTDLQSVAVEATQPRKPAVGLAEAGNISPARVAQTQAQTNVFEYMQEKRAAPTAPKQLSMAPPPRPEHFSPSRKERARPDQRVAFAADTNTIDDYSDHDEPLFGNNMGTPPAPFIDHQDDFGVEDDDEMLQFAEDIENSGLPAKPVRPVADRPVFHETSANSQSIPLESSAKKRKKLQAIDADAELADLFRFPWSDDVAKTLKHRFKLKGFRQGQVGAINATLGGKDVFVLMPTGGGKSLCYQLPSLITSGKTKGVTVVISPLLSLMEDQVHHLRALQIQAYLINSETKVEERRAIFDAFNEPNVQDFVQLLYVTPEMLSKSQAITNAFSRLYNKGQLARLVIDEAHCVSQWGHDFRPDYKLIGDVRRQFPRLPVMALTATATENVKVDVIHNLGIDGCEVFARSFNRPNLYYEVRQKGKGKEDLEAIAQLIQNNHRGQTGIIYCLSRKNCEDVAKSLAKEYRIRAHHFHAGMDPAEKSDIQKKWQAGQYHVIVATIAFGMGIDKANVRYVIHHSMPKSLEGYYQETGRAGRDGKESSCYLFYGFQDAGKLRRMIDDGEGSREQKDRQHQMLRKMTSYCTNRAVCRRVQVLAYFSERFDAADCNGQCDNCNSTSVFEERDLTDYAVHAINLLEELQGEKVTLIYCMDVFRGAQTKKVTDAGHNRLDNHGKGKGLERGDIERLFNELLSEGGLKEYNEVNRSGFANQYMQLGPRAIDFKRRRRQLKIQVCTSPNGKAKALMKKASSKDTTSKSKKATGSRAELPISTFVSSPIQQAVANRGQGRQPQRENRFSRYAFDEFTVPDDENDEDYSDSDDGFEPIREGSRLDLPAPKRSLGQRITADATMGGLNEIHRAVVEQFVQKAKEVVERIKNDDHLHGVPFTDTMLRQMAIQFTETEDQMLQVSSIDPEMVRRHSKKFTKLVKDCHRQYNEMMSATDDAQIMDPNLRNVIDLVSDDDDEDNDDYGPSINGSDLDDGEEEEQESSGYFQPDARVQAFNQRFANSQLTANNSYVAATQSQAGKKAAKPRKHKWKARGSTSYGKRKASDGGSRAGGSRTSGRSGGASNSRSSKKSASSSTAGKRSGGGASGGFSMMPT